MIIASDLEGTLTTSATWKGVASYLKLNGKTTEYRIFLLLHLPVIPIARIGLIEDQAFKNWWMRDMTRFLKGMSSSEISTLAEWIVENELWINRREDVIAELERHSKKGNQVILLSGAWQPVLEAFASRIGAVALGTPLEMVDGKATGRLAAPMNTGKTKIASLQRYLRHLNIDAAYGDTGPDIPMLEISKKPVAVYPDKKLRTTATARGWRILEA
jgi:HAD superfamily phosphoserine phosphatase-like hydrolase